MVRDHQRALEQGRARRAGRQVLSLLSHRHRFRPPDGSLDPRAPAGAFAGRADLRGGALDFQRGTFSIPGLADSAAAGRRATTVSSTGSGRLRPRQGARSDVFFYGNAFAKDNPHQTDAAFGYTPDTPFGLDNVHMAQGDPSEINMRLHENGVWHDGACFIWDEQAKRMTAIFLAFQSQAWHTNDQRRSPLRRHRRRGAGLRLSPRRREPRCAAAARGRAHLRPSRPRRLMLDRRHQHGGGAARSLRLGGDDRRRRALGPARDATAREPAAERRFAQRQRSTTKAAF